MGKEGRPSGAAGARVGLGGDLLSLIPRPPSLSTVSSALSGFNLGTVLLVGSGLFCLATLYFGTRGGYYDTKAYEGNGTAH
jgi:hypothetical protein